MGRSADSSDKPARTVVDRRLFLNRAVASATLILLTTGHSSAQAPDAAFDVLLNEAVNNDAFANGRDIRERQTEEFAALSEKGGRTRAPPSERGISDRAVKLIISFEVTSEKQYTR